MTFSELVEILNGGGIVMLIVWFFIEKVWPVLTNRLTKDQEFKHNVELERAEAARVTSDAIAALSKAMIATNERIAVILNNQTAIQQRENDILQVLNDAISDMKEAAARSRKKDTGPLAEGKA